MPLAKLKIISKHERLHWGTLSAMFSIVVLHSFEVGVGGGVGGGTHAHKQCTAYVC